MLADLGRRHALTQEPHRLVYPRFLDTRDVGAELVAVAAALAGYRLAHQLAMEAEARAGRAAGEAQDQVTQLRADAARERDELRAALESRAQVLEESRGELRARAERAERDLDAARAELTHIGQGASTTNVAAPTRGRRTGRTSEGS